MRDTSNYVVFSEFSPSQTGNSTPTATIQQSNQQVRFIEINLCNEENTDHLIQQWKIFTLLQKASSAINLTSDTMRYVTHLLSAPDVHRNESRS